MTGFDGTQIQNAIYLLARSPDGELGAVMRFVMYAGNLSLDTMQRVGATPNGLNEALVARALAVARERGIPEVSLNYAGLAHLVRGEPSWSRVQRAATLSAHCVTTRRARARWPNNGATQSRSAAFARGFIRFLRRCV